MNKLNFKQLTLILILALGVMSSLSASIIHCIDINSANKARMAAEENLAKYDDAYKDDNLSKASNYLRDVANNIRQEAEALAADLSVFQLLQEAAARYEKAASLLYDEEMREAELLASETRIQKEEHALLADPTTDQAALEEYRSKVALEKKYSTEKLIEELTQVKERRQEELTAAKELRATAALDLADTHEEPCH